ncbi:UNVERIFIED_CONTAM: hypothetical protein FKN15_018013 [Acipenser sinensis]
MNRIDLIPMCILACCVLHNICLCNKEDLESIIDTVQKGPADLWQLGNDEAERAMPAAATKHNRIAYLIVQEQ